MRRKSSLVMFLVLALTLAGCETMGPETKTGAVAGGLLGATAGGIVGHQSGHGLEGAAIGGALGALGGGAIGSSIEDRKRAESAAAEYSTYPAPAYSNYVPLTRIAELGRAGLPDSVIIDEIRRSGSTYRLDSESIAYLKANKVSDRVINYMLSSGY